MSAIDLANRPQFMLSSLETLSHDVMVPAIIFRTPKGPFAPVRIVDKNLQDEFDHLTGSEPSKP
jgi:hypothetical protein